MSDPNVIIKPLNNFVDKILRKLTKFPIYTKDILSRNNWKILRKSEVIILTTDLLALSLVPYLIILSLIKKVEIYVIVMGLFGRISNNFIVKIFQSIYLKILNSTVNKYLFLGKEKWTLLHQITQNLKINLFFYHFQQIQYFGVKMMII